MSLTRPFLFGGNTSSQSQNKYLVEFRAGKMTMKGKIVHPDKRKGTVFINQTEDSLMHFCWRDRTSGSVEDDLIIFPDDAEFKKVSQCTTGRVFVLKFKSSSRRCFYWMQEPKADKDDEYCSKVNEYLNNPPLPGSTRSGISGALGSSGSSSQGSSSLQSELSNLGDGDLQSLLNNMSQQQLMQLLAGGVGGMTGVANLSTLLGASRSSGQSSSSPNQSSNTSGTTAETTTSTTTPSGSTSTTVSSITVSEPAVTTSVTTSITQSATSTPAPGAKSQSGTSDSVPQSPAIQLSDLQSILSGLNVPQTGDKSQAGHSIDLSSAINADALQPLLSNSEFMDRVQNLLPPTGESPAAVSEHLRSTVQSPQFQQALSVFSAALHSGQLGPLMLQFGMTQDVVDAANSGDMDAFVRALQNVQNQESDGKDKDQDEEMSLD